MKQHNRTGKMLFYMGILLFALGFALNQTIGRTDIPEQYTNFSIPFIVVGILVLIASNFFKNHKSDNESCN